MLEYEKATKEVEEITRDCIIFHNNIFYDSDAPFKESSNPTQAIMHANFIPEAPDSSFGRQSDYPD